MINKNKMFSISTQFISIWSIDKILSGAITPSQREHGGDGNKGVLSILQKSRITEPHYQIA